MDIINFNVFDDQTIFFFEMSNKIQQTFMALEC